MVKDLYQSGMYSRGPVSPTSWTDSDLASPAARTLPVAELLWRVLADMPASMSFTMLPLFHP